LYAGGLFHCNKAATTYGLPGNGMPLYRADDANPLINDLGIYILDKLGTFQNMQDTYKVTVETDLFDYVGHSTVIVDGTKIYRFSTELLAYLEMCVAFSPYYRQDDPCTAGAMDTYFRDALQAYADVPSRYKDLHTYLERRFRVWYTKFKPASAEVVGVGGAEVGDIVSVEGVDAPPPPAPAASSDEEASGERTGPSSPALNLATLRGAPPA
jgi:hypothetical protein